MANPRFKKGDVVYLILENRVQEGVITGVVSFNSSTKYDIMVNAIGKKSCFEGELYGSKEELVANV